MFRTIKKHGNIVGALMLREMVTRYGREGIGFLWIAGEPLMFCFGVMLLWTLIKPEYEHGIRVAPFVMTGYMCILTFRHLVTLSVGALQANIGLMHHRVVRPLHIFASRFLVEFGGGTMAFIIVYTVLLILGKVSLPHDILLLYSGWLLIFWVSCGFSLVISSLAMRYEVLERTLPVLMYTMIPLSGAFAMVAWIPDQYQWLYLLNPLPHTVEMVRAGVFGEFVETHYHPLYVVAWAAGLTVSGLLLLASAHKHLEIE